MVFGSISPPFSPRGSEIHSSGVENPHEFSSSLSTVLSRRCRVQEMSQEMPQESLKFTQRSGQEDGEFKTSL